jgi:hypothetical protein
MLLRRLLAALVLSLSCDPSNTLPPSVDAAPIAAVDEDRVFDQLEKAPILIIPPIEIVSIRQPRRILVVGDSEACRVGFWIKATVKAINDETRAPHDDVHVSCKGGTVIQYWGSGGHLAQALREYPNPDDVVVFLGTNHYWVTQIPESSRVPGQLTLPMVRVVTDQLKGTNCIWVGNTAVKGHTWAINGLLKAAVTPQCSYFDTEAAGIPLDDDAHPGHAGAVKWLRMVWATIPDKYEEATNGRAADTGEAGTE